MEKIELLKI